MQLAVRAPVDDVTLSRLHAAAFDGAYEWRPWNAQLTAHSLSWVTAHDGDVLVGFVNVAWDGGAHAFLLDCVVDADRRHAGLGTDLVRAAAQEAARAGCTWLHVDFEHPLTAFYVDACGFRPTAAGVLRLDDVDP